jgi:glycine dehydrogenase subunit 1
MFPYIPLTKNDEKVMLDQIGIQSVGELFNDIPEGLKLNRRLDLDAPKSELEVARHIKALSKKNKTTVDFTCFLGAGAYDHYVPSVVNHLSGRSEFYTSYTPYQPEISQGTLRAIFEYQTMISNLTGLDIANASLYDVSTAVVEAAIMTLSSVRKSDTVLVSKTVSPEVRKVLHTYMKYRDVKVIEIDMVDGETCTIDLKAKLGKNVAGVIVQSPNFFGIIEDVTKVSQLAHENGSYMVMSVDPISLGILKKPSELGADIAVGEGQALGNYLNFGGPYLGFIAATEELSRKMPGRICGQSEDKNGKRAFVLTLQAREQHIRRYKATSNICSNQGLLAVRATIYLSTLGKEGLKEVAQQCMQKAHYAAAQMTASGKYELAFNKPFFKEFAIKGPEAVVGLNEKLLTHHMIGGFDCAAEYETLTNTSLYCVTEKRTKAEIDALIKVLEVTPI